LKNDMMCVMSENEIKILEIEKKSRYRDCKWS